MLSAIRIFGSFRPISGGGGGSGEVLADVDYTVATNSVIASVKLLNDGRVEISDNGGTAYGTAWLTGTVPDTTGAALFEIYSTKTGGTAAGVTQPTQNTWLPLSTSRTWSAVTNGSATRNLVCTVKIREIANPSNIVTITIDVSSSP